MINQKIIIVRYDILSTVECNISSSTAIFFPNFPTGINFRTFCTIFPVSVSKNGGELQKWAVLYSKVFYSIHPNQQILEIGFGPTKFFRHMEANSRY